MELMLIGSPRCVGDDCCMLVSPMPAFGGESLAGRFLLSCWLRLPKSDRLKASPRPTLWPRKGRTGGWGALLLPPAPPPLPPLLLLAAPALAEAPSERGPLLALLAWGPQLGSREWFLDPRIRLGKMGEVW